MLIMTVLMVTSRKSREEVLAVVDSLEQQDGLTVCGLREQVHRHGSHWTERRSVNAVRWRSAQTDRETEENKSQDK